MPPVNDADKAIQVAQRFLLKKYPMRGRVAQALKAIERGSYWVVEFNVGVIRDVLATIHVETASGAIKHYDVPLFGA